MSLQSQLRNSENKKIEIVMMTEDITNQPETAIVRETETEIETEIETREEVSEGHMSNLPSTR
jgi:hypothetical protein